MTESQGDHKVRRAVTGILAIGALIATAVAAWRFTDTSFGDFSQRLGLPLAGILVTWWAADYYYEKDSYKKRTRDIEVSVYTTRLLMAGVEIIKRHIAHAKIDVYGMKPNTDDEHTSKLNAHSEIEAAHTAAELTIHMSYMALTNFEAISKEAVKSANEKFVINEKDATVRQQIVEGKGTRANASNPTTADENLTNNEGGGDGND